MPTYRDRPPSFGDGYGSAGRGPAIADLLMYSGQSQADGYMRSGADLANAVAMAGQQLAGGIQQRSEEKARRKQADAVRALFAGPEMPSMQDMVGVLGPEKAIDVAKGWNSLHPDAGKQYQDRMERARDAARGILALPKELRPEGYQLARGQMVKGQVFSEEELPPDYNEGFITQAANYGMQPKEGEDFTLGPNQVRYGKDGQEVARGPVDAPKPAQPRVVGRSLVTDDGKVVYRDPETASKERFWVIRNGKPIRISEADYQPGDLPASTREQGRPVTSGDAGKIADFDTSLDDLNQLTTALGGNKATGTSAKVGAMLPNAVTNLTGWGTDAKQKQATIDRVKQVIGKALEGGVLRKEDEYKYEKILPTIGDGPELVAAKLDGLWKAITQRRQTQLDALSDAGYDVTKYGARAPRERVQQGGGDIITTPDGKRWKQVDGHYVEQ